MTFREIIREYGRKAESQRDKGDMFEDLMARYFMTDPVYADDLEWVYSWMRFPFRGEFGGRDVGIDLVAKTKKGDYWAIQCKCYAEDHTVSKADMDTFLSTSSRIFHDENNEPLTFTFRLIVATTDRWSSNALDATHGQVIPVSIIQLSDLDNAQVDWDAIERGVHGPVARGKVHELRKHQREALEKAMAHYSNHDRGKMIMACGTGKTFTSLRIAEEMVRRYVPRDRGHPGTVLFLAPSISLVGQTLREWKYNTEVGINAICVCSDTTVSKTRVEDEFGERPENLGMRATTDETKIVQGLSDTEMNVVFSTYQSIDAVIRAQSIGLPEFDLIVCDEAHRTTGIIKDKELQGYFTKVHDNTLLKGARRLYMTATPRIYGEQGKSKAKEECIELCSMDDESKYGATFYELSFGRAVEKELLSDYKVMILAMKKSMVPPSILAIIDGNLKKLDPDMGVKLWGCLKALSKDVEYDETLRNVDPAPMKCAVSFSNTIARSLEMTSLFNHITNDPHSGSKAVMCHIDGGMNAMERDRLLNWLKEGTEESCHILSNVKCLSEGVDVPALDAVMFMDAKKSMIDVVQSVGRVMRKAEGKRYGYIFIPVVAPEDTDPDEALNDDERYRVVWQVLRALRSHDERLEAEINNLMFSDPKKSHGGGGKGTRHVHVVPVSPNQQPDYPIFSQFSLDDFADALMLRVVTKVGNRQYIEDWAAKVAKVVPVLEDKLTDLCAPDANGTYPPEFESYLRGLRACVNDKVPETTAIRMLVQQIVTKPIFNELFTKDGDHAMKNSVSQHIDRMLMSINQNDGLKDLEEQLDEFYRSVRITLEGIDTTEGKQKVITALYEKFFKNAFPKDQAINGIVYTPQEIVDFIIRSCAEAIKQEFGMDINDENVNVLDPFTGTGTFIARLLESGLIDMEHIAWKYKNELFANEITLLAYYIATVNIENTYARVTGTKAYEPFDNILLTDTFNIEEICKNLTTQTTLTGEEYFIKNRKRIRREHEAPITIIMGNPPYGAAQKNANDNAKKRKYTDGVDQRIAETYLNSDLMPEKPKNLSSIYNNYVRAYRWASDRIGDNDGVICFVTPNSWMKSKSFEGFRKSIESEFSSIYVFDLRGDQLGPNWNREGDKIFGDSAKVGIAVVMLVRHRGFNEKATIHYYAVPDKLKKKQKLDLLTTESSFSVMESSKKLEIIKPRNNGDWMIERNNRFSELIPLAGNTEKKFEKHCENTIFVGYSRGYATARDEWIYNFSHDVEEKNISSMIDEYNRQTSKNIKEYNSERIKWNRSLEDLSKTKTAIEYDTSNLIQSYYRPFTKQWFYNEPKLIDMPYKNHLMYPAGAVNKTICVSGVGVTKEFTCLMTDTHTDLEIVGKSQCFPLYWYDDRTATNRKKGQTSLFDDDPELVRHDGISDFALNKAREKYGDEVTKEDIFYYVYGYLHSPEYRQTFSDDLKMSLPRIDFVDSWDDFYSFCEAGRELAKLHLDYEHVEPNKDVTIRTQLPLDSIAPDDPRLNVVKMDLDIEKRRLVYNQHIVIEDIPEDAIRYMVNGKTALGWIVDRYAVSKNTKSGIVNDPNLYAGGRYILDLILSVITVSVETMRIVDGLPKLDFGEKKE